jgi:hypothetical protein
VGDSFDDLGLGEAVDLADLHVCFELGEAAAGDEAGDGDQAAVPLG